MDRRSALAAIAGLAAGCGRRARTTTASERTGTPATPGTDAEVGFTHVRATGNRYATGGGDLGAVEPVDVALDRPPAWLAGVADGDAVWAVVADDGTASAVRTGGTDAKRVTAAPPQLPAGAPPVVTAADRGVAFLRRPADIAAGSAPLPVAGGEESGGGIAYVAADGDLVLALEETHRLALDAPQDARVVAAGEGRLAVLADATDRYRHGALGDDTEAGSVAVVGVGDDPGVEARYTAEGVFEALSPIVADVAGDGRPEVVVTESGDRGAREVAFGAGTRRGPPVGSRFRWRHQLAVAPFAPDGVPEIAAVRTPHIGGVAEFYRADDGLDLAATLDGGYRSHEFGSRNLDGGLAADADGDGRPELIVPVRDRESLAVVDRTADGAREAFRLPVGGRLTTNLAATPLPGGGLALAAGHAGGLRAWVTRP
ncbi:MAG: hypothetical protein ABEH77_02820 [Halobacteriaceae archaeon]